MVTRLVHTDVKGWTLADLIDDAQYEALQRAAPGELARFVQAMVASCFARQRIS